MNWCEYPGYLAGSEVLQNYGCRMASGLWVTFDLVAISVALLTTLELLRRRSERLRGMSPG